MRRFLFRRSPNPAPARTVGHTIKQTLGLEDNVFVDALKATGIEIPDGPRDYSDALAEAEVTHTFAILITGRTGSTWLAAALKQMDGFNHPAEYFSEEAITWYWREPQPQSFQHILTGMLKSQSRKGCFGFKINPGRLERAEALIDFRTTFGPDRTAWIDMRRLNLVKQALSFLRARKTGAWHLTPGKERVPDPDELIQGDAEMWAQIAHILREERRADAFLARANIQPLRIWYEEIAEAKQQLLLRVIAHVRPIENAVEQVAKVTDGTTKISQGESEDELRFVERHAALLNDISSDRSGFDIRIIDKLAGR